VVKHLVTKKQLREIDSMHPGLANSLRGMPNLKRSTADSLIKFLDDARKRKYTRPVVATKREGGSADLLADAINGRIIDERALHIMLPLLQGTLDHPKLHDLDPKYKLGVFVAGLKSGAIPPEELSETAASVSRLIDKIQSLTSHGPSGQNNVWNAIGSLIDLFGHRQNREMLRDSLPLLHLTARQPVNTENLLAFMIKSRRVKSSRRDGSHKRFTDMRPELEAYAKKGGDPTRLAKVLDAALRARAIKPGEIPDYAPRFIKLLEASHESYWSEDQLHNRLEDAFTPYSRRGRKYVAFNRRNLPVVLPYVEGYAEAGHEPAHLVNILSTMIRSKRPLTKKAVHSLAGSLTEVLGRYDGGSIDPSHITHPLKSGVARGAIPMKYALEAAETIGQLMASTKVAGLSTKQLSELLRTALENRAVTYKGLPELADVFTTGMVALARADSDRNSYNSFYITDRLRDAFAEQILTRRNSQKYLKLMMGALATAAKAGYNPERFAGVLSSRDMANQDLEAILAHVSSHAKTHDPTELTEQLLEVHKLHIPMRDVIAYQNAFIAKGHFPAARSVEQYYKGIKRHFRLFGSSPTNKGREGLLSRLRKKPHK